MSSLNKATLIGNLGKDPELRATPSGKVVASLSIATDETWPDPSTGEKKQHTEWHEVEVWGAQAEAAGAHLKKGERVYVEGRIRTDRWEDKETKEHRSRKKIVANRIIFAGARGAGTVNPNELELIDF